jgi:hypothetical protein
MVQVPPERSVPVAVILPDLRAYGALVHSLATSTAVVNNEFTVQAPLYKGTAALKEALSSVGSALEKFEVYIQHAILNEEVRNQMAQAFRKRYLARHPMSEGRDVFVASGEVLNYGFTVQQPTKLMKVISLQGAVSGHPHDKRVLEALLQGESIDRAHLTASLRIFLDNVYNPRRRNDPVIAPLLEGALAENPVVLEVNTNGAIPGIFIRVLEQFTAQLGGAVAMLHG